MPRLAWSVLALLSASLISACKGADEPLELSGCDPVDPTMCALPYPSSYFLREDPSTATGLRVAFWDHSFPVNLDGVGLTPTAWNRLDGFSPATSLALYFEDVALDGVIPLTDLDAYTATDAKTVIVDVETGERIPHFVELDATAPNDTQRLLFLRPLHRLEWGRRYVVGVRGLVKADGSPVDVSPAFRTLRDGGEPVNADVILRQPHYEDAIFPVLTSQGFLREELQIAWDFTVASRESVLGDAEWIRDDALSFIEDEGLEYVLDSVEDGDCETGFVGRTIEGRILGFPLYLEEDRPGRKLARDASDRPTRNGTRDVEFLVRVPCSVVQEPGPAHLIQYGHGFFGDRGEARAGWLAQFIHEHRYVVVAANWTGMTEDDAPWVALAIANDISEFAVLPEGTLQGFVEQMAVLRLARFELPEDPALVFSGEDGPVQVLSADRFAYYGISQGGILGGAYVGLSPDIERAVFSVTGGPYTLMTHRSRNFDPFFDLFKAKFDDHRDISLHILNLQMVWDQGDNSGWGFDFNRDVPEGMPTKQVLIQNAIGDYQVTTIAGHQQARMYGARTVAPQTRPIFGIEEAEAPFVGSAIVEWSYADVPAAPTENVPPEDVGLDPHECPRRNPAAQAQVVHFIETGEVEQFCEGPCADLQQETCP